MEYTLIGQSSRSTALTRVKHPAAKTRRLLLTTVLLSMILGLLIPCNITASGRSSARGVAMGEAFTGLAMGIDAARYNPANLGLSGYQQNRVEIVGFGANISNNSFTLGDYNRYSGAFLTNNDKNYLLDKVPSEGLSIAADVEASALSVSIGSFVFSTSGVGLADVDLNKDIIDLILNGNSFADTISATGSFLEGVGYISTGLSYGTSIYKAGTRQLAVGGSIKYLRGLAVERIIDLEGLMATYETGFTGNGHLVAQTATGGSGLALDIGAALCLNDSYTAGIHIKNFLSFLSWNKKTEEHGYIFSFDTMTVDNMGNDYVVSDSYSKKIRGFSTNLPSVMTVGIARTAGSLLWAVDWEQGFRRAAGASSKPRLSLGLEWWPIVLAPLRTGLSIGGNKNTTLSFGSGVNVTPFYLDFAVVTGTSLWPYSAKTLNFALSTGFYF